MTPDDTLRAKLRLFLDERIPAGGLAADTRFSADDIDTLLSEAATIQAAAAAGWRLKAAWAMSERGGLQESQAGSERLKFVSLESYRDHCLAMAALYEAQAAGSGSRIFAFDPPDVLGVLS